MPRLHWPLLPQHKRCQQPQHCSCQTPQLSMLRQAADRAERELMVCAWREPPYATRDAKLVGAPDGEPVAHASDGFERHVTTGLTALQARRLLPSAKASRTRLIETCSR